MTVERESFTPLVKNDGQSWTEESFYRRERWQASPFRPGGVRGAPGNCFLIETFRKFQGTPARGYFDTCVAKIIRQIGTQICARRPNCFIRRQPKIAIHSIGSALAYLPAGILADRIADHGRLLLATFVWVAVGYALSALAPGFWTVAIMLAVAGLGDAAWHPIATGVLVRLRPERRAEALGVHMRPWQDAVRAYLHSADSPVAGGAAGRSGISRSSGAAVRCRLGSRGEQAGEDDDDGANDERLGLAAARAGRVHAGQIVQDERGRVHHLHRTAGVQGK